MSALSEEAAEGGRNSAKLRVVRRLALPGAMAIALLLSLAYWWLENLAHELFGATFFALLAWHISVNRLWFRNLPRGRYDSQRVITVSLHLWLVVNMAILAITSIVISRSLLGALPIPDNVYLRDVHWFAAYWVMIVVGMHLGLHWTRIMALVRVTLGLPVGGRSRTWTLRLLAFCLAAFGIWSWSVLGVGAKLTFTYSLEFWDFTASVTPFFGHWAGVVALPAIAVYYSMLLLRRYRPKN